MLCPDPFLHFYVFGLFILRGNIGSNAGGERGWGQEMTMIEDSNSGHLKHCAL